MTRKKRIYCAGPYSQGNPLLNVQWAIFTGNLLMDKGFHPFIPHLSHYWDQVQVRAYEDWMEWCLNWVSCCDALLRIPGISPGSDREVLRAGELKLPVYFSVDDLIKSESPTVEVAA